MDNYDDIGLGIATYLANRTCRNLAPMGIYSDLELDDLKSELISIGFLAFTKTIQRYEPEKGTKVSTFVYPRIHGAIKDHLRSIDSLSQDDRTAIKGLERAVSKLQNELGRQPTKLKIATELGVSLEELDHIEGLRRYWHSIDGAAEDDSEDGGNSPYIISIDPTQEKDLLFRDIDDCLDSVLDAIEQIIFQFKVHENYTLNEIVDLELEGVATTSTAHRRLNQSQEKMLECLKGKGWDKLIALQDFN